MQYNAKPSPQHPKYSLNFILFVQPAFKWNITQLKDIYIEMQRNVLHRNFSKLCECLKIKPLNSCIWLIIKKKIQQNTDTEKEQDGKGRM